MDDVKVGDRVRSYDFPGRKDCYLEGTVEEITAPLESCRRYVIRVERSVFAGVETLSMVERIYPPVNGTRRSTGGVCSGVERI